MTVTLIRARGLYQHAPYAYASIAPEGSLIFTAGACPLNDKGEVLGVGDVRAQASLAMANLGTALAAAGATLADVLKTTVFVASAEQADLAAAWQVISAAFGDHDAPSTLLGVTVLGYANQLVEIEAIAASPEGQLQDHLSERAVVHGPSSARRMPGQAVCPVGVHAREGPN
jgi:enamine deaminase RidA (YjgF/YER057c/UK114 family)